MIHRYVFLLDHLVGNRQYAYIFVDSFLVIFASNWIKTPSPGLNLALRAPGFKILDPFETSITIP